MVGEMLDAVLFDWGDTLFRSAFDDATLRRGWAAGLAAIGRDGLPDPEECAACFREQYLPRIYAPELLDEVDYTALVIELLGGFGVVLADDELVRFLAAEHAEEIPARRDSDVGHSLLDALRALELSVGLVSNVCDPSWLVRNDLEWMELAPRLDVAVFSSDIGKRKPHPAIFEAALEALDADPARTLFVGDRCYEDVLGARELGMATVLARWFREDADPRGADPDYVATTPDAVLEIVRTLHR